MEFFLILYRVTVDGVDYYGRAGVASNDLCTDWTEVKAEIYDGYRINFLFATTINIEPVKAKKITLEEYGTLIAEANKST
jgi:hypothetical protein